LTASRLILFAVTNPIEELGVPTAPRNLLGMRATDLLLVIAVTCLVATALVIWALFIRKPKEDAGREAARKARPIVEEREDGTIRKRKRLKRLRRAHRTRNPTLAEAGGLPPMREDGSQPPI
jgi:hypothetical protein